MMILRLASILLLLLALLLAAPAHAQQPTGATGVFCDTQEQIIRFAKAENGKQAVDEINAETGAQSCMFVSIVVIPGRRMQRVDTTEGPADVLEVLVIAVRTPMGIEQIDPVVWYGLVKPEGIGA